MNKIFNSIKQIEIIGYISIILFAIYYIYLKFDCLELPFFWDEAWVYSIALKNMAISPSLMPDKSSIDLTRGHPLLFHFLGGVFLKIFGVSIKSIHAYSLTLTITFILSFYFLLKNKKNHFLILITIAIVFFQQVIYAQSILALPEIALMGFIVLSVISYSEKKIWATSIFLGLALLTKETAIVVYLAFVLSEFFELVTNNSKSRTKRTLIISLSILPLLLFFVIQYLRLGFVFYPEHIEYLNFNFNDIQFRLHYVYNYIFWNQGRDLTTWTLLFAIILSSIFNSFEKKISVFFLLFLFHKIITKKFIVSPIIDLTFLAIILTILLYIISKNNNAKYTVNINILISSIFGLMLFSAINFLSNRYLVTPIALYFIMLLFFIYLCNFKQVLFYPIMLIALFHFGLKKDLLTSLGDDSMGYSKTVKNQKNAIKYIEDNIPKGSNIACDFLFSYYLNNSFIGYTKLEENYFNYSNELNNETTYFITSNTDVKNIIKTKKHNQLKCFNTALNYVCIYKVME